ncbi:hypothetical protein ACVIWV_008587 [Bradyrhizobium diazoefficiens]
MKKDLREVYLASNRASAEVAIDVFAEKYGAKYDGRVPDERSRRNACVLRIPRRALGPLADDESHRKRVREGPAQNGAHERFVIVNDCQVDGVQAALRRIKDLAAAERHKSVDEGQRRCQIRKRHRGHPSAGKPRRLIASSPKIPHSSDELRLRSEQETSMLSPRSSVSDVRVPFAKVWRGDCSLLINVFANRWRGVWRRQRRRITRCGRTTRAGARRSGTAGDRLRSL